MSSPHPFQAQNWKGRNRPNFLATTSKFSKSIQLLKMFKWYWYDFLIYLLVSNFQKNPKAFMSISKGVHGLCNCMFIFNICNFVVVYEPFGPTPSRHTCWIFYARLWSRSINNLHTLFNMRPQHPYCTYKAEFFLT